MPRMGIMGNTFIPLRWFSFLCPFPSLIGPTPVPSAPDESRAAGAHLSESGCLALCQSATPYGAEQRHTHTHTTPTKNTQSPSVHTANIQYQNVRLRSP